LLHSLSRHVTLRFMAHKFILAVLCVAYRSITKWRHDNYRFAIYIAILRKITGRSALVSTAWCSLRRRDSHVIVSEFIIIFTNVKAECHRYWKLARNYNSIPIFSLAFLSLNCVMSVAIGSTPMIQDEIPALSILLFSFVADSKVRRCPIDYRSVNKKSFYIPPPWTTEGCWKWRGKCILMCMCFSLHRRRKQNSI